MNAHWCTLLVLLLLFSPCSAVCVNCKVKISSSYRWTDDNFSQFSKLHKAWNFSGLYCNTSSFFFLSPFYKVFTHLSMPWCHDMQSWKSEKSKQITYVTNPQKKKRINGQWFLSVFPPQSTFHSLAQQATLFGSMSDHRIRDFTSQPVNHGKCVFYVFFSFDDPSFVRFIFCSSSATLL